MAEVYTGIIVSESLQSQDMLSEFTILSVKETVQNKWHLYTVCGTKEVITHLSFVLIDTSWYTHFWNDTEVIIVFKNKVFIFKRLEFEDKKQEAIEYGVSLGIPIEQLDFPINS